MVENSIPIIPSEYQSKILDWVKAGKGNACCNAVAGSGKTTTLRLIAIALKQMRVNPKEIRVIVFNKHSVEDLKAKFGREWWGSISTLNSAGWSLLKGYLNLESNDLVQSKKYETIAQSMGFTKPRGKRKVLGKTLAEEKIIESDGDFLNICNLVRCTNGEGYVEEIKDICDHHGISGVTSYSHISGCVRRVLEEGEKQARTGECFDFTDQIWLPVRWGLRGGRGYQFILIDECQDLNTIQLELALTLAGDKGRVLAVGDPRQAIYGFAGADCESYSKIVNRLNAIELPLSLCYRCPKTHVELVNRIFPHIPIKATETAIRGSIKQIKEQDLWSDKPCRLKEGDMVLSRRTSPLVNLCLKLIAQGIAATVKGREIGNQLKTELSAIAKISGFSYQRFNDFAVTYRSEKSQKYRGLDNEEELLERLKDRIDSIRIIYRSQTFARSIDDLNAYIDDLFSDNSSPVTLSTAHRAKGLEGDRVFIIEPEDMPMQWRRMQDWQKEQEDNLLYVALTRSKNELYIVGFPEWMEEEENDDDLQIEMDLVNIPQPSLIERVDRIICDYENNEIRELIRYLIEKLSN